jgi:acetyl-CoA acyltransferase
MRDAVIVEAVRTPIGKGRPSGALAGVHPVDLLAHTLRALIERSGGSRPRRRRHRRLRGPGGRAGDETTRCAWLAAGFPESVPATTVAGSAARPSRRCTSPPRASSPARTTSWWPAGSSR